MYLLLLSLGFVALLGVEVTDCGCLFCSPSSAAFARMISALPSDLLRSLWLLLSLSSGDFFLSSLLRTLSIRWEIIPRLVGHSTKFPLESIMACVWGCDCGCDGVRGRDRLSRTSENKTLLFGFVSKRPNNWVTQRKNLLKLDVWASYPKNRKLKANPAIV